MMKNIQFEQFIRNDEGEREEKERRLIYREIVYKIS